MQKVVAACRGWQWRGGTQRRSAHDGVGYGLHAAHPEFVPTVVVLDPPPPGTAAMMRNEADHAGTTLYKCAPTRQWRRDGEGGGSGTERVAGQWRGHGEGGGGAQRGWVDSIGISVGGQHVGCEIRTSMGIGSVGA